MLVSGHSHSCLVRHIFHPWHAPPPLGSAQTFDAGNHQPAEDGWQLATDTAFFLSSFFFFLFNLHCETFDQTASMFIQNSYSFIACQSVSWCSVEIMELQTDREPLDAVFCVIISLPVLLLVPRYDIPFWIWYFHGLYFFFFFFVSIASFVVFVELLSTDLINIFECYILVFDHEVELLVSVKQKNVLFLCL